MKVELKKINPLPILFKIKKESPVCTENNRLGLVFGYHFYPSYREWIISYSPTLFFSQLIIFRVSF